MDSTFGLALVTDRRTLRLLKLVGIEPTRERNKQTGQLEAWAPSWAVAICEEPGVSERLRVNALRRCSRDAETQQWLSPLLGILEENQDRIDAIENVARESERTLICACGAKFESALKWQEHLDPDAPECPIKKKEKFDEELEG